MFRIIEGNIKYMFNISFISIFIVRGILVTFILKIN